MDKTTFILLFLLIIVRSNAYPRLFQVTPRTLHSEGPTWDHRKQILYFVDIPLGKLFAYHFKSEELHSVKFPGQLALVVPSKDDPNILVIGLNRSVISIEWDGENEVKKSEKLLTVSPQFPNSRFNDGKADAKGRLWFGTMANEESNGYIAPNEGVLYKISNEKGAEPIIAPLNISNGLTWSKDNTKFFHIDSPSRRVLQYDFDVNEGTIRNGRVCFDLAWYSELKGVPDGMTIDREDKLWVALYGGGGVVKVDPIKGKVMEMIALPAKHVSSVMWGGPNYDILFVTTSRKDLKGDEKYVYPAAGSVFGVSNLGTKGMKVFEADI